MVTTLRRCTRASEDDSAVAMTEFEECGGSDDEKDEEEVDGFVRQV